MRWYYIKFFSVLKLNYFVWDVNVGRTVQLIRSRPGVTQLARKPVPHVTHGTIAARRFFYVALFFF